MPNARPPTRHEFTLLDGVIEIAKSECPDVWRQLCEATPFSAADSSKEGAGKRLLSTRRLELGQNWEITFKTEGKGPNYMHKLRELGALENAIGQHALDAIRSEAWSVEGYLGHSLKKRSLPSDLMTLDALLDGLISNAIVLGDGTKLLSVRLVMSGTSEQPRRAPEAVVHREILAVCREHEAEGRKAPSKRKMGSIVKRRLQKIGYYASANWIEKLAGDARYNAFRREPGTTLASERHRKR
jgi:hypothetical protein